LKTEVAKFQATRKATRTATVQVDQVRARLILRDRLTPVLSPARREAAQEAAPKASRLAEVEHAQDRMNENRGRKSKIRRNRGEIHVADHGKQKRARTALNRLVDHVVKLLTK